MAQDNDGKTPLHYAAALKDGGAMYDLLVEYGADESKLDNVSTVSGVKKKKIFIMLNIFFNLTCRDRKPRVSTETDQVILIYPTWLLYPMHHEFPERSIRRTGTGEFW